MLKQAYLKNVKYKESVFLLVNTIVFIFIVFVVEHIVHNSSDDQIEKYAKMLSVPLWSFDDKTIEGLAKTIAVSDNYLALKVFDYEKNVVVHLDRRDDFGASKYFFSTSSYTSEIVHKNSTIGVLEVEILNTHDLNYLYWLIFQIVAYLLFRAIYFIKIANRNYQVIFDSTEDGIFLHNYENGDIVDVNASVLKMFDFSHKKELLKKKICDLSASYDGFTNERALQELSKAKTGKNVFEWKSLSKLGREFWTEVCLSEIVISNKKFILAIVRNIHEKKMLAAEQEAIKSQMITSSRLAVVGEMASGVAHEINNPLTIISGNCRLIKNALKDNQLIQDKEFFFNYLDRIDETVSRISKIIRGLMTYSRDGTSSDRESIYVSALIEKTLVFCREKFKNKEVVISIIQENPKLSLIVQEIQLSQVLLNLLSNAYDAVVDNDAIMEKWIRLEVSELCLIKNKTNSDNIIQIKVVDAGCGIPEEIADKIMNPFFTTKGVGKGTGLGLSISHSIIVNHGGKLYLDKTQKNTTFVVELPV